VFSVAGQTFSASLCPLASTEHRKPTLGLDHHIGDSGFVEPVAEVVAAWWRGVAAPPVELKERSLSPASLSEKRGANQLSPGFRQRASSLTAGSGSSSM
jgi:hypothetical protein